MPVFFYVPCSPGPALVALRALWSRSVRPSGLTNTHQHRPTRPPWTGFTSMLGRSVGRATTALVFCVLAPVCRAEPAVPGCSFTAEQGVLNLHANTKCSPEQLESIKSEIKASLAASEPRGRTKPSHLNNWVEGRERNLGRLGEFPTALPVSPLHR